MKPLLCLCCVLCLAACGPIEREYTWTSPAAGLIPYPVKHRVRINVDVAKQTVVWLDDATDGHGFVTHDVTTYGENDWDRCHVFDPGSFSCKVTNFPASESDIWHMPYVDQVELKDGKLVRTYWGKIERYESRVAIGGFRW
jgi:hypothetical protein